MDIAMTPTSKEQNADTLRCRFYFVDVFANEPLSGNPLAVVVDAEELSNSTMQRIAREFNQSETSFILSPVHPDASWRLRSFTPSGAEVFGAGHNALGAWWWLAEAGWLDLDDQGGTYVQEIGKHRLPVEIVSSQGSLREIAMTQAPLRFGKLLADPGAISHLLAALHLDQDDLDAERWPPQVVSTGAEHLMVSARTRTAVSRAAPEAELLRQALGGVGAQGCYLFCLDPVDVSNTAHARFFNPTVGIWEDPATGSAAGPLACYLVAHEVVPDGHPIIIEQGYKMGRPSQIAVRVLDNQVRVSGRAVIVAGGTLML